MKVERTKPQKKDEKILEHNDNPMGPMLHALQIFYGILPHTSLEVCQNNKYIEGFF